MLFSFTKSSLRTNSVSIKRRKIATLANRKMSCQDGRGSPLDKSKMNKVRSEDPAWSCLSCSHVLQFSLPKETNVVRIQMKTDLMANMKPSSAHWNLSGHLL